MTVFDDETNSVALLNIRNLFIAEVNCAVKYFSSCKQLEPQRLKKFWELMTSVAPKGDQEQKIIWENQQTCLFHRLTY